jgi:hypothetical protein
MKMPASHSCCQKTVAASHVDAVQPESGSFHLAFSLIAFLPPARLPQAFTPICRSIAHSDHSPPSAAVLATAVLRI